MRLLLIGVLIVVLVHAAMSTLSRLPSEKLGRIGQFLARFGMVLGIFVPRLRAVVWYLTMMWPFFRARGRGANASGTAASQTMSVSEAQDVLGVGPKASADEINAAWRQLLKKHHPDQGGSADYTRRLNEARKALLKHLKA